MGKIIALFEKIIPLKGSSVISIFKFLNSLTFIISTIFFFVCWIWIIGALIIYEVSGRTGVELIDIIISRRSSREFYFNMVFIMPVGYFLITIMYKFYKVLLNKLDEQYKTKVVKYKQTYLRDLEITELTEVEMPMVYFQAGFLLLIQFTNYHQLISFSILSIVFRTLKRVILIYINHY